MRIDDAAIPGGTRIADPSIHHLVGERIELLRKRLLDFSRRNPLVHITFKSNAASVIRVVDEVPDLVRVNLTSDVEMRFVALPPIEEDPRDELSGAFLDALFLARREDEAYVRAMEALDPDDAGTPDRERVLERELKDRIRERLGLARRAGRDAVSLVEHARQHGIAPSYDLPHPGDLHDDGRHDDDGIQTLMTPDRLRRAGKTILERGRSIEREIGVNVQHAVFGIVEWKHPEEKETHFSPLLLLEVRFDRRSSLGGEEYRVSGASALTTNTTLREKFLTEYRLELPEYEGGSVEDYFDLVREKAPKGWDWKVRRQLVFGIFPSSRMAMYHDLDPAKRPLAQKELITRLLASTGNAGPGAYAPDYEPDAPDQAELAPFVVRDADSSQWSALVDVLNGKNVALEGPPGSGKSQTIVNIIAACLAAGKRVLFVAEKLTALDVVKSRIEASGLGEFVLALQAGKASADQVYASIADRLDLVPGRDGKALQSYMLRKEQLDTQKRRMQGYLDVLSRPFGASGLAVQQILGRSIRTADLRELMPREVRRAELADIQSMTPARRDEILADAALFQRLLQGADHIPELWMQGETPLTTQDEAEDLAADAGGLAQELEELRARVQASSFGADPKAWTALSFTEAADALRGVLASANLVGADALRRLLSPDFRQVARGLVDAVAQRRRFQDALALNLKDVRTAGADIRTALDLARAAGGAVDPGAIEAKLSDLRQRSADLQALTAAYRSLGARWSRSGVTAATLRRLCATIGRTPAGIVALTGLGSAPEVQREVAAFEARRAQVDHRLAELRASLPKCGEDRVDAVLGAADVIEAAGLFARLGRPYKDALAVFQRLAGAGPAQPRPTMVRLLRDYGAWLRARDALSDPALAVRFGAGFQGHATDPAHLAACRTYAEEIASTLRDFPDLGAEILSGLGTVLRGVELPDALPDVDAAGAASALDGLGAEIEASTREVELARAPATPFRDTAELTVAGLERLLKLMAAAEELEAHIAALEAQVGTDLASRVDGVADAAARVEALLDLLGSGVAEAVLADGEASLRTAEELARRQARTLDMGAAFLAQAGLTRYAPDLPTLAALEPKLIEAAADAPALLDRVRVKRAEKRLRGAGLDALVDWATGAGRDEAKARLPELADALLAKGLADVVHAEHRETLHGYSGEELDEIRKDIAAKDREVIALTRQVVRARLIGASDPPQGVGYGRRSDFTEMALIRNELGKRRRRVAIRELTRRSWRSLLELKPCWMMSPLAVSQFLLPSARFDVVIIDEASQMTPENALGAISRADRAVIVGDTKQLPPTSFFARTIDDDDVDDDLREDAESILDLANLTFTPIRQLRWHYRSQHADLIRFSNHWMYDGKLTIFPSADQSHAGLGVEVVRVDGTYSAQMNVEEARAVVRAAVRHMEESSAISLGICTMNTRQRDLVEEEMDRERLTNPHVQAFILDWETRNDGLESFFVKNLEAIQGDERDVMFISTVYGPEQRGGRTAQRFGQINSAQGHRRLNVLFSRAKRKIVTFTSLDPTDILVDQGKSKGVQMFRNWLEYGKSGQLGDRVDASAGHESPFEEHVAKVVESLGFQAVPQVGSAGYRVDLGIRHPDWPHGFVVGVECDGATYHSSRSARDRDRLREEILTGLGWTLYRIWSTDWFSNPHREKERLRQFLEARLRDLKALPPRRRISSFAEVLQAAPPPRRDPPAPQRQAATRQPRDPGRQPDLPLPPVAPPAAPTRPPVPLVARVRVGSRVTIRHDDGEVRTYAISGDRNDPVNGILRKDVPLARAMLDLEAGEDFEYPAGSKARSAVVVRVE